MINSTLTNFNTNNKFIDAINNNDNVIVTEMLKKDPQLINMIGENRETPLMIACVNDRDTFETINVLIEYGASVNSYDDDGNTSLLNVASYGNYKILDLLLKNGANVNAINNCHENALIIVCKTTRINNKDALKFISILLENKIDINQCDLNLYSPLIIAEKNKSFEIVELLLKTGNASIYTHCPINILPCSFIEHIEKYCLYESDNIKKDVCKFINSIDLYKTDPNDIDSVTFVNLIVWGCYVGAKTKILKKLLQYEPSASDLAISFAFKYGGIEIIKLLLNYIDTRYIMDTDKDNRDILSYACQYSGESIEIIELVLDMGASFILESDDFQECKDCEYRLNNIYNHNLDYDDQDGYDFLDTLYDDNQNCEICKKNKIGGRTMSPLMVACRYSNSTSSLKIVQFILDQNDVNVNECINNQNALTIALYYMNTTSSFDTVKLLLESGAKGLNDIYPLYEVKKGGVLMTSILCPPEYIEYLIKNKLVFKYNFDSKSLPIYNKYILYKDGLTKLCNKEPSNNIFKYVPVVKILLLILKVKFGYRYNNIFKKLIIYRLFI